MINNSGIHLNRNILNSAKKPQHFVVNNNQQCGVLQESSPSIDTYKARVTPSFKGAIPERFIHVWMGGELPEFNVKNWLKNSSMNGHENFETLFITDDVAKTKTAFHKHLGKICSDVVLEKSELIKNLKAELSSNNWFFQKPKKKEIQKQIENESNSLKTIMDNVSALKKKLGIIGDNSALKETEPKKAGIVSVDEFFNDFAEFAKANGSFTPKEVEMLKAAVLREMNGHHKNLAAASDILRNMALFVHGGHYLDGDVRVLKSLKEINNPEHGVFYRRGLLASTFEAKRSEGGNSEISAVKGNELIQACLQNIIKSYRGEYSFAEKRTGLLSLKKEVKIIFAKIKNPEKRREKLKQLFNTINNQLIVNKLTGKPFKKEEIPESLHGFFDRLSKLDEKAKTSIGNLTGCLWLRMARGYNPNLEKLEKDLTSRIVPTMEVSGPNMIREVVRDTSWTDDISKQKLAYPDSNLFYDNANAESFSQSHDRKLQRSQSVSDISTGKSSAFSTVKPSLDVAMQVEEARERYKTSDVDKNKELAQNFELRKDPMEDINNFL